MPSLSQTKVTDFFYRLVSRPVLPPCPSFLCPLNLFLLQGSWAKMGYQTSQGSLDCHSARPLSLASSQGPLSVFSTKNRWQLVGPVHMTRGEDGFGFTLRGDSPVLVAAVVPGGQAEVK